MSIKTFSALPILKLPRHVPRHAPPSGTHNSAAPLRPRRPSSLPVNTRFYGIRGRDSTGNAKIQFSYIAPNSALGAARGAEKTIRSFSSPVRKVRDTGGLRIHDAAPACIRFRGKLFSIGKILIILLSKKSIIIILAEKLFSKQSKTRVLWGVFGGFEIPRGFSFFVLQKRRKRRTQAATRGFRKISGRPLPLPPCISRKINFLHIAPDFEPFSGIFSLRSRFPSFAADTFSSCGIFRLLRALSPFRRRRHAANLSFAPLCRSVLKKPSDACIICL